MYGYKGRSHDNYIQVQKKQVQNTKRSEKLVQPHHNNPNKETKEIPNCAIYFLVSPKPSVMALTVGLAIALELADPLKASKVGRAGGGGEKRWSRQRGTILALCSLTIALLDQGRSRVSPQVGHM